MEIPFEDGDYLSKIFNKHFINTVEKKVLEIPLCQKMMKKL